MPIITSCRSRPPPGTEKEIALLGRDTKNMKIRMPALIFVDKNFKEQHNLGGTSRGQKRPVKGGGEGGIQRRSYRSSCNDVFFFLPDTI